MLLTPKRAGPRWAPTRGSAAGGTSGAGRAPRHAAQRLRHRRARDGCTSDEPDVPLDVPTLRVDEIDLQLDDLKARVALEHVLDLLRLDVGVAVELSGVRLQINGVETQALLKVHLDNLTQTSTRVMSTIDRNPQILDQLTERIGASLDRIGRDAAPAVEEFGTVAHAPDATASHNGLPK